jgi:hypothetical protein
MERSKSQESDRAALSRRLKSDLNQRRSTRQKGQGKRNTRAEQFLQHEQKKGEMVNRLAEEMARMGITDVTTRNTIINAAMRGDVSTATQLLMSKAPKVSDEKSKSSSSSENSTPQNSKRKVLPPPQ